MPELAYLTAAYFAGIVATRLGIPAFVGYLVAGLMLAAGGYESTAVLHTAGHVGVLLLLFTIGLQLSLRHLLSLPVLLTGSVHILLGGSIFAAIAVAFSVPLPIAVFLGVTLGFSSTVLAAKVLEARSEVASYHGRVAIGILILQDLIALAVMAYLGSEGPRLETLWLLPFLLSLYPVSRFLVQQSADPTLLVLLAVLLAWGSGTVFEYFDISGELGALIAGLVLAGHRRAKEVSKHLWGMKEILMIGFFLSVGMTGLPPAEYAVLAIPLLLILPAKAAFYFLLLVASGLRARTAFLAGATLTSYSEFTLLAGAVAMKSGLIDEQIFSLLALVTAVSFVIHPIINHMINRLYDRLEPALIRIQRANPDVEHVTSSIGSARYIVVGVGQTGKGAYAKIAEAGLPVLGLDENPAVAQKRVSQGLKVLVGDASDYELWSAINLDQVEAVILTLPVLQTRLRAIHLLRKCGYTGLISAFALHPEEAEQLKSAGADVVSEILPDAGAQLVEQMLEKANEANPA